MSYHDIATQTDCANHGIASCMFTWCGRRSCCESIRIHKAFLPWDIQCQNLSKTSKNNYSPPEGLKFHFTNSWLPTEFLISRVCIYILYIGIARVYYYWCHKYHIFVYMYVHSLQIGRWVPIYIYIIIYTMYIICYYIMTHSRLILIYYTLFNSIHIYIHKLYVMFLNMKTLDVSAESWQILRLTLLSASGRKPSLKTIQSCRRWRMMGYPWDSGSHEHLSPVKKT